MNSRNTKVSFDKFDEMVNDHNATLTDVKVTLREATYTANMSGHGNGSLLSEESTIYGTMAITGVLNDVGMKGLCQRLGAPKAWLQSDDCPPDLEEYIIHRLSRDHVKDTLIRYRGRSSTDQIVRAVLSDQYLTYNHLDMWRDVRNSIEGTKLMSYSPIIWKPYVSDAMDAWILFDGVNSDPEGEIRMYDGGGAGGLKPAIHVRNAEDGTGKVKVDAGLYRSYCANGVIFGFESHGAMQAVHRGNTKHLMSANVAVAVAAAAQAIGIGIDKFIAATKVNIKENVIDEIADSWAKRYNLAVGTTEDWRNFLAPVRTYADLVMATADFAGTLSDRDETTTLEAMSGDMLIEGIENRYLMR